MHFATMMHHATKTRPRSVQFDKNLAKLETATRTASFREKDIAVLVPGTLALGNRASSLPVGRHNEIIVTEARQYRSLLDVEDAPKLPMAKPLTYGELYPNAPNIVKAPLKTPFDS